MSKLIVEVCKIENIAKHPNADRLSIVTVKGWNCIVSLDQYKVGDLVVYCPPDSVIPNDIIEKYSLEFLKKNGRVGTIKLRKYISQGLILSMDCLPGAVIGTKGFHPGYNTGMDVAKKLGITKYEVPIPTFQRFQSKRPTKKKRNPLFDKYTDIDNIKNYKEVFKEGELVVITEKIHGTNFRAGELLRYQDHLWGKIKAFLFGKYEFVYGSHNVQLLSSNKKKTFYGENVYGRIAKKYNLAEIIPEDYIVYGEIYGKGIQDLEYGKEDIDMVVFDVKYKGNYLNWEEVVEFCLYRQLPTVPILTIEEFKKDLVLTYTDGASKICATQVREGCVIKPVKEENDIRIGRKILKSVSEKYLLRKGGTEYK